MCGIFGLVSESRAHNMRERIIRLTSVLRHRGPDDLGVASLGGVWFGHTRLSILGLDDRLANQPIVSGQSMLTFNGEIYNYRELQKKLVGEGVACGEASDTEVLFKSLIHWGVKKTLEVVDGMFAFSFLDGSRDVLYLVRDRLGEKPMYWSQRGGEFVFASEIKPILASSIASPHPNLKRIDDYFYTGLVNGTSTMFNDVNELRPGTVLTLQLGQLQPSESPYWSLESADPTAAVPDIAALEAEFLEHLTKNVRSRSIADVDIGILQSGGIDSCAITELFASDYGTLPPLFFADGADPRVSEGPDVNEFVSFLETRYPGMEVDLRTERPDFSYFLREHSRLTWHFDEPMVFTNANSLSALCATASKGGVKVLLSGEGADELLYGYDRFTRTSKEIDGDNDKESVIRSLYLGGGALNERVVQQLCNGRAGGKEQTEPWQWLEENYGVWENSKFQSIFSQKFRLLALLNRQDRVGMSHGVECRLPYLVPCFVEWMNKLPMSAKYEKSSGRTKYIMRLSMAGRLPDRILNKPKDGFPSGIERWMRSGRLQPLVTSLVSDKDGFVNSYLDGGVAQTMIEKFFEGHLRYEYLVWRIFNLELWHRIFSGGNLLQFDSSLPDQLFASETLSLS